jgi:hypothetical protein
MDEIYSGVLKGGVGKRFEEMRKTLDGGRSLKRIEGANLS